MNSEGLRARNWVISKQVKEIHGESEVEDISLDILRVSKDDNGVTKPTDVYGSEQAHAILTEYVGILLFI